jgi:hypothetical protein
MSGRPVLLVISFLACLLAGCFLPTWPGRKEVAVLSPMASREEVVNHLNRNVLGHNGQGGLMSWQTSNGRASMPGLPLSMTTSIAVSAPRNFRLRIAHPVSGNQEADIGSNEGFFWIWVNTPESCPVLMARHEDVELAMEELDFAIPIHPDWLMEVFGVVPLDPREFELHRPEPAGRYVELLSRRTSPTNQTVTRVIRVNTVTGQIAEHQLRDARGKVMARAELDNYRLVGSGICLPHMIRLGWPPAHKEIRLELGRPEVNSPHLLSNTEIWQPPQIQGAQLVDVGLYARQRRGLAYEPLEQVESVGRASLDPQHEDALYRPEVPQGAHESNIMFQHESPWGTEEQRPSSRIPIRSATRSPLEAPDPHPSLVKDAAELEWAAPVPAELPFEYSPTPP